MFPKGAVWSGSILFVIYAINVHKQMREQTANVMTGGKMVK